MSSGDEALPRMEDRLQPDLITFDCYGTLIDWEEGIARAYRGRFPAVLPPDTELVAAFHEIQNEIEAGEYRPYRQVLRETAHRLAAQSGVELAPAEDFLARSLPSWAPFPDANPALERLKSAGYRLGILSNIDNDLLAHTLRHFSVSFDLIVTAEQVRSYKPAPAHFHRALQAVAGDAARLLHVARSYFHDVQAARPLGIPVVWVNRSGERRPHGPVPTAEVQDVAHAAEWIEAA